MRGSGPNFLQDGTLFCLQANHMLIVFVGGRSSQIIFNCENTFVAGWEFDSSLNFTVRADMLEVGREYLY